MTFDAESYINEPRWRNSSLGLERMEALLDFMGNPQKVLRFVHGAGTNGKGSICAFVASMVQAAGYRVGLFTSPYVQRFSERIRVNGEDISPKALKQVTLFVRDCATKTEDLLGTHPTEFELMAAVALEHFRRQSCELCVMEVGLGGRLDATNIIPAPEVAFIARLGLDHTDILGDSLPVIANEKAGIIKPGSRVVAYPCEDPAVAEVLKKAAAAAGDLLTFTDFSALEIGVIERGVRHFTYKAVAYETALLGSYQPFNAAVALDVVDALNSRGFSVDGNAKIEGIAKTAWFGRFSMVSPGPPPIIVDGGHNPQGAKALVDSLKDAFPNQKAVFIMGVLADKDYEAMIKIVAPLARAFIAIAPSNPRALLAEDLAQALKTLAPTVPVAVAKDLAQAKELALDAASSFSPICLFGSLYNLSDSDCLSRP